jgi:hypothetical protein
MHKSATKCNETIGKWCKNKHGASKIIDTFETYQSDHRKYSVVASGDDIARFTCLDMLFRSFFDLGTDWIIADM